VHHSIFGIFCFLGDIIQSLQSSRLLSRNAKVKIYKTIILPVVLYGCETWSVILREEHRLRVFENRVLRRIFGPKRDEKTSEWRKFHSGELHNFYSSPKIVRLLRRMWRRSEDEIKIDLREIGWEGVEWIQLAEDRDQWNALVNAVMNLLVLAPRS
jgi:hypothetical protein